FANQRGRVWTGFHRCIPLRKLSPRAPSASPVRRGLATSLATADSVGHWTNGAHPGGEPACPNGQCPRLAHQHSFTRRARIYLTDDASAGHNSLFAQMMTWSSEVASDVLFPILGRPFRARAVGPELERWLRREWGLGESPMEPHRFEIGLTL